MKTRKNVWPLLLVLIIATTGCKKYDDGPTISLRTKTERVANNWKVGQAYEDGKDVTSDYNRYELNTTKGGNASLSAKYKFAGNNFDFTTEGTWSFVNDKKKISFNFDNNDADGVYQILKLKEDEMWMRKDGETLELHLIPR
jgi:hypothetical protein